MDHYDMEEGHLMKKLFAIMTAVLLFAAGAALAQEQKPVDKNEGFSEWLKALQRKIETMTAKKSIPMSTGVGGGPSVRPRSRRRETPPQREALPHVSEVEYVTVLAKSSGWRHSCRSARMG